MEKIVEPTQTPGIDPFARMIRTNSEKCNKLQTFIWHENHAQASRIITLRPFWLEKRSHPHFAVSLPTLIKHMVARENNCEFCVHFFFNRWHCNRSFTTCTRCYNGSRCSQHRIIRQSSGNHQIRLKQNLNTEKCRTWTARGCLILNHPICGAVLQFGSHFSHPIDVLI